MKKPRPQTQPNATAQRARAGEAKQAAGNSAPGKAVRARRRDWRPAFLGALAECHGLMAPACQAARVDRVSVWRERQRNPDFATRYEEARQLGALRLEEEATRRAVDGCKKLVLYQGQPVLDHEGRPIVEVQYSDRLLELLLKRHFPDKYREKLATISATATASAQASAGVTSDEELARLQETRADFVRSLRDAAAREAAV